MTTLASATERFERALDALESALALRATDSAQPAMTTTSAALTAERDRLNEENGRLRIAHERDVALREEAIERVDLAIAALREALGEADGAGPAARAG